MATETVRVIEAGEDQLGAEIAIFLDNVRNEIARAKAQVQAHVFTYPIIKES